MSHAQLYELRKRMGMLFQSGALLTDISVFDNVALPLIISHLKCRIRFFQPYPLFPIFLPEVGIEE